MKYLVWTLIALLVVLHQDYWIDPLCGFLNIEYSHWNNASLLLGILPHSLVYHAVISVAAALVWWMATKYCWPCGLDDALPEVAEKQANTKARQTPGLAHRPRRG